ncbi:MAG: hypothetical protein GY838_11970 [bacterium]|nr:hypothetical protein [bacterium]
MSAGRRPLLVAGLAGLVLAATVIVGLIHLHDTSRTRLDEALGERLLAVARGLAFTTDPEDVFAYALDDSSQAVWADSLAHVLESVARVDHLAEITITDPDGRVLLSTAANLPAGQPNDWWALDPAAVEVALAGDAAASRLYRLGTVYQKSAHAAVVLDDPWLEGPVVVGVVTVSGSPDFFDSLAVLRRGAGLTGGIVVAIVVLMLVLLYRMAVSVNRYRDRMLRQEHLAAMGRMTAGIAHEIRNPLGIIRGSGEHLARVLDEAGIEDEVAGYVTEEVDRLDRILSGYLAFGRDTDAADEVFDLDESARRCVRLAEDMLATNGVTAVCADDWPRTPVRGDPRRLQQVLLNLLLNARDAMPTGGEATLALNSREGRARLTVTDVGTGLADRPERLFEPFRTTKEKGSGLGLALSRRIVEDMGGTLDLTDRSDAVGAVAILVLPLVAGD